LWVVWGGCVSEAIWEVLYVSIQRGRRSFCAFCEGRGFVGDVGVVVMQGMMLLLAFLFNSFVAHCFRNLFVVTLDLNSSLSMLTNVGFGWFSCWFVV